MEPGQIVVFPFPYTDGGGEKLRPALLLARLPGEFDDWLLCMISSQQRHYLPGMDELITPDDADYFATRLRTTSVIRATRLAVVNAALLSGRLGSVAPERLNRIRHRLSAWLLGE